VLINRAKALLLVGTISSGCASNDDGGPDSPGVAGSAGAAGAGNGGTSSAGSSGQGGGGAGGTPSAGGSGQGGGAGNGGTPSAGASGQNGPDAGNPDAGGLDAGADADTPDGPDASGDAGGTPCDDSTDVVVDCDGVEGNQCSEQESFLSFECEMFAFTMKPATMNAARNCMIALDPPELCAEANTYSCMVDALASSCPDPEADDECTAIVSVCDDPPLAFSECTSTLSGMTQDGRDQIVACMTNACDLNACVEGLTF
jgi:hypothetical protein